MKTKTEAQRSKRKENRLPVVRVLIADDDPIVRRAVRSVLESFRQIQVAGEAADGEQAVEAAEKLRPDILLLDLQMPNLPGMETLRKLSSARTPTRTILLCSAISKRQVLEALQLGARAILLKSAVQDLESAIQAVMQGEYWIDGKRVANVVEVVQQLSTDAGKGPHPAEQYKLTRRELEIIDSVTQGLMNRDIGTALSISEETVKRHLTNIFNKVGMSNRLELALFAIDHGLVSK
jgi:two-component system nitrate/nitrite response regulator NarL